MCHDRIPVDGVCWFVRLHITSYHFECTFYPCAWGWVCVCVCISLFYHLIKLFFWTRSMLWIYDFERFIVNAVRTIAIREKSTRMELFGSLYFILFHCFIFVCACERMLFHLFRYFILMPLFYFDATNAYVNKGHRTMIDKLCDSLTSCYAPIMLLVLLWLLVVFL